MHKVKKKSKGRRPNGAVCGQGRQGGDGSPGAGRWGEKTSLKKSFATSGETEINLDKLWRAPSAARTGFKVSVRQRMRNPARRGGEEWSQKALHKKKKKSGKFRRHNYKQVSNQRGTEKRKMGMKKEKKKGEPCQKPIGKKAKRTKG